MATKNSDELLRNFFDKQKQEIPDNGFTQRVMRDLPDERDYSWVVWASIFLGLALTLFLGFQTGFIQSIFNYFKHISTYYLLITVFAFPLISSVLYLIQSNRYKLI